MSMMDELQIGAGTPKNLEEDWERLSSVPPGGTTHRPQGNSSPAVRGVSPVRAILDRLQELDDPIDYRADAPKITQNALSRVTLCAQELLDKQAEVTKLEKDLATAKERQRRLEEVELPEAMAEATMTEFKTTNGKQIVVQDIVAGAPSKAEFPNALEWLRSRWHDGIIKRSITLNINLPKGQDAEGDKLVKYLNKLKTLQKLGVTPKDEPTVHYQTFGAWARELRKRHVEEHLNGGSAHDEHMEHHTHDKPVEDCEYCTCPFCSEEDTKLLGIFVGKKAVVKDLPK